MNTAASSNMVPPSGEILQIGPISSRADELLANRFNVTRLWEVGDRFKYLMRNGSRFIAAASSARHVIDAQLIGALPNVKIIASSGVGYDAIDVKTAQELGIVVTNTPDVLNDCVADLAWALVLDVTRRLSAADRYARSGEWARASFPLTTRASGKRLGIIGLGRIGSAIARRASGFDMQIGYHGRSPKKNSDYFYEPDLLALAAWCDILIVACPGGEETRGLVSSRVLDALGPEGMLVNIARGSIVDQTALVKALQQGKIAAAGLDAYAEEPNIPEELTQLENVVLLPHIGSATRETRAAMEDLMIENLSAFLNGKAALTPISA